MIGSIGDERGKFDIAARCMQLHAGFLDEHELASLRTDLRADAARIRNMYFAGNHGIKMEFPPLRLGSHRYGTCNEQDHAPCLFCQRSPPLIGQPKPHTSRSSYDRVCLSEARHRQCIGCMKEHWLGEWLSENQPLRKTGKSIAWTACSGNNFYGVFLGYGVSLLRTCQRPCPDTAITLSH
jgi:hypothetical protein